MSDKLCVKQTTKTPLIVANDDEISSDSLTLMAVSAFIFLLLCIFAFIGTVQLQRCQQQQRDRRNRQTFEDVFRDTRFDHYSTPQVRLENADTLEERDLLHDVPIVRVPEYPGNSEAGGSCFKQPGDAPGAGSGSVRSGSSTVSGHHLRPDLSIELERTEWESVDDAPPPYTDKTSVGTSVDRHETADHNSDIRTTHL